MTTLPLSPMGGLTTAATPTGTPVGEAVTTLPNSHAGNAQSAQAAVAQRAASVPVAATQAASTKASSEAAAAAAPALDLKVGLVQGTFNVYVDLTDQDQHVIARLYGPRGTSMPAATPAPAAPPTPASKAASGAYGRSATPADAHTVAEA